MLETSATQSPSSYVPSSAGTAECAGSQSCTSISRRYSAGVAGFCAVETALTNTRPPPASVSTAAAPGENPPTHPRASTTAPPASEATASRTTAGRSAHASRTPCPSNGDVIAASKRRAEKAATD